jgi:hypothetical protein
LENSKTDLATLLAKVLDEFAFELDVNYEQAKIAELVLMPEDSTFSTFCDAVQELRERRVPVTERVLHVERRIEAALEGRS